jgi:hypothetical protein
MCQIDLTSTLPTNGVKYTSFEPIYPEVTQQQYQDTMLRVVGIGGNACGQPGVRFDLGGVPLTAIVNHSTSDTGSYDVISVSQLGPNEAVGSRPLARMDGNYGVATATSGSPTLVKDSPANFTAADVGKTILVAGAGAAGADLITTIAGFVSGSTVTLSVNASTNVHDRIVWGTDDAPAWQAAINLAIFRRGGNIVSSAPQNGPGGGANYSSLIGAQLNLTHWKGGSIAGTSGGAGGGNAAFPMLSYLPAVGSLFRATSCFNLNIKDLTFTFENRAYNGDLIYYSSDGSDNSSCLIERCGFFPMNTGASGFPSSLNSYIRLDKTIFSHIDMCSFGEGPVGSAIYLATGYTVQSTITRCNFSHTLNHILFGNADTETVVIDSNTFEPNWGGTAGAIVGAVGNRVRGQLTISNNWFGDFNFGGRCHIENINAYITGATVFGNDFNSPLDQNGTGFGGACFGKCSGGPWDIFGNGIASGFAMIDLTVSTGAEGGRPNNMHFHDNSIGQTTNWFSNGTLADLVAFRFDRSNYIVTTLGTRADRRARRGHHDQVAHHRPCGDARGSSRSVAPRRGSTSRRSTSARSRRPGARPLLRVLGQRQRSRPATPPPRTCTSAARRPEHRAAQHPGRREQPARATTSPWGSSCHDHRSRRHLRLVGLRCCPVSTPAASSA